MHCLHCGLSYEDIMNQPDPDAVCAETQTAHLLVPKEDTDNVDL